MRLGPVELAAAGVSIALFNQASRITIFPLVSITTSFVAEEDTIERMNIKASKNVDDAKLSEIETPKDQLLQDIENGEVHKENIDVEKYAANNDTNVEDGTCFLFIISSHPKKFREEKYTFDADLFDRKIKIERINFKLQIFEYRI